MSPRQTKMLWGPLLILILVGAILLRQPHDQASAFSDGGAVYTAYVLTPTGNAPTAALAPHLVANPAHTDPGLASLPPSPLASSPLAPPTGFDLRGRPTISVAQIEQVLAAYGSPMAGEGKAIYSLGVQYGIDPAYCLAFFVHESGAGTRGEAVLTHNLGNIRTEPGKPSLDGYRYYPTWLEGAEDWYRLMSTLYIHDWKLTTVDKIVPVYAPSADSNDPIAYIDDVEQLVSAWRAQA